MVANRTLGRLHSDWEFNSEPEERRAHGAMLGLMALGPEAEAAVPELVRILLDPSRASSRGRAAFVLAHLGGSGVSALLAAISNRQLNPTFVLQVFQELGKDARPAIPAFQKALKDPDKNVRDIATNVLRLIDPASLDSAPR